MERMISFEVIKITSSGLIKDNIIITRRKEENKSMIEITFEPRRLTARGHAADDVGCAAVSAILYALAGGLENLAYPVKWRIESGCAEIPIPDSADASAMRLMAEVGLRQLAGARDDIRILDD